MKNFSLKVTIAAVALEWNAVYHPCKLVDIAVSSCILHYII